MSRPLSRRLSPSESFEKQQLSRSGRDNLATNLRGFAIDPPIEGIRVSLSSPARALFDSRRPLRSVLDFHVIQMKREPSPPRLAETSDRGLHSLLVSLYSSLSLSLPLCVCLARNELLHNAAALPSSPTPFLRRPSAPIYAGASLQGLLQKLSTPLSMKSARSIGLRHERNCNRGEIIAQFRGKCNLKCFGPRCRFVNTLGPLSLLAIDRIRSGIHESFQEIHNDEAFGVTFGVPQFSSEWFLVETSDISHRPRATARNLRLLSAQRYGSKILILPQEKNHARTL